MTETELTSGRAPRPNTASLIWFLFMTSSWIVFAVIAATSRETLADFWSWARGLSLAAEVGIWVTTLPWLLASGVLEASWDAWLRALVLIAIVGGWMFASLPRSPGGRSAGRDGIRPDAYTAVGS